ncbi:MAG TPA: TolC family protein [Isosphaeraceae bacterium]|nr:TolC family protein [Isosphaeraceae bacterium]
MMLRRLLLLSGLCLASGCTWAVREETNQAVRAYVEHPYDIAPEAAPEAGKPSSEKREGTSSSSGSGQPAAPAPESATDVQAAAWMEPQTTPSRREEIKSDDHVHTVAFTEFQRAGTAQPKVDLNIPPLLPGSEAPKIQLPTDDAARDKEIHRIYPDLPPLPVEPKEEPGPEGRPYTLADLQRLASANSPALLQAASDVEAAKGNLIQAKTYPNPLFQYLVDPSNNNSTAGVQGVAIDQPIRTGGKQKLGSAAAQKDLDNAVLALRRARSDLSTAVRNAYFALLVAKETMVVTGAVAHFTDDIYRLQTGLLSGRLAAPYEPASLRAQAFTIRLAYRQAIAAYIFAWQQLVATIGVHHLPLTAVAGRVDRFIPYYDYDQVLAYALQNHTDVLTARNVLRKAQYNLKLNRVTPIFPDLDVRATLERDLVLQPFGTYSALQVSVPLPIWDQNKGNIIAAQAGLIRASEESHRVEVTLTNNLAAAYANYKNNLYAVEYYRRNILPDLVRYYRGVFDRRQVDQGSAFGDLVFAQQTLSSNVTAYLGVLGTLWTSVVSVADFLQTDDLFQLAQQRPLPDLPDFRQLPVWLCEHGALAASCEHGAAPCGSPAASPGMPLIGPADAAPPPPAASGAGASPPPAGGATPPVPSQGAQPPAVQPPAAQPVPSPGLPPFRPEGGAPLRPAGIPSGTAAPSSRDGAAATLLLPDDEMSAARRRADVMIKPPSSASPAGVQWDRRLEPQEASDAGQPTRAR